MSMGASGSGRGVVPRGADRILACAAEPEPPAATTTPAPTTTPPPTAEPTAEPTPEPTEEPWERFTDERMPQSFETPPDWTVREVPSDYASEGQFQFELVDAAGTVQLHLLTGVQGLGGACGDLPVIGIEELDSEPIDATGYVPVAAPPAPLVAPRFVFRASQLGDQVLTSVSISNDTPPASCMYYNLTHVESGPMAFADTIQIDSYEPNPAPPRTFATMDEARAYMQTEEYATLKRVLLSLRFGA